MAFYTNTFYHYYVSLFATAYQTIVRNIRWVKFEDEVYVLKGFIAPGDVCIDVGGAYGRYALPMARLAGPSGKVYSFEPGSYSHQIFSIVKAFHRLKTVSLHKMAVSSSEGTVDICLPTKPSGKLGASLAHIATPEDIGGKHERVPVTTLDAFCARNGVGKVSFIKCDTEGGELMVFEGAVNTIEASLPTVLSEVDGEHLARYGGTVERLESFFTRRGYGIFQLETDKQHLRRRERIGADGNYFFIHQSRVAKHVDSGSIRTS